MHAAWHTGQACEDVASSYSEDRDDKYLATAPMVGLSLELYRRWRAPHLCGGWQLPLWRRFW
jgi:hypothetical protein